MTLELQVDDIVTRQQLNQTYGGGIQGGMLTPAGGRLMFAFSDPQAGAQYGYDWDGWADGSLQTFFYTGEGRVGDQEFVRRNKLLRDSRDDGREVHLFVAEGRVPGSQTRLHRYLGRFTVDPLEPWRREDAPDENRDLRSVLVFRLNRAEGSPAPNTHTDERTPELATRSGAELVGPEAANADRFERAGQEAGTSERRERKLETDLHRHLRAAGRPPARLRITIKGQARPLFTDTWDPTGRELYEAKGSVSRHDVRLAVGQLMDYRRHITPPPDRLTVLLPSDPGEDLVDLVHSAGMDLVFQDDGKFIRRSVPGLVRERGNGQQGLQDTARTSDPPFPLPASAAPARSGPTVPTAVAGKRETNLESNPGNMPEKKSEWMEVRSIQDALAAMGLDLEEFPNGTQVLQNLADTSGFERCFRVTVEWPKLPNGAVGMLVPRTRFWLDLTAAKSMGNDVFFTGVVFAATQDLPLSAAVALVRKGFGTIKRLTEDEAELVTVIIGKSAGNPYKHPVREQDVRKAYVNATVSVSDLLDSLTDKGVITSRRNGRLQLKS